MAKTVSELIELLEQYPGDHPIIIEEAGDGAVGYALEDHGVVNNSVVLVFDNVVGD